jgi:hypothetical protein
MPDEKAVNTPLNYPALMFRKRFFHFGVRFSAKSDSRRAWLIIRELGQQRLQLGREALQLLLVRRRQFFQDFLPATG